jgi:hypothetical protein
MAMKTYGVAFALGCVLAIANQLLIGRSDLACPPCDPVLLGGRSCWRYSPRLSSRPCPRRRRPRRQPRRSRVRRAA